VVLNLSPVVLAYAQEATKPPVSPAAANIGFLILLFAIFYFLLIRPQQKKAKEHRVMLTKLEKGDNVITSGGLHGRITSVSEDTVTVEIAENVRVKLTRSAVAGRKPQ
jgi:preprotein translocase subunit YajC